MAGDGGDRSLEETPTWAVGLVTLVMVGVSVLIEYIIHLIGKWLKSKHKRALNEALEKIKSELMLLGFISLMLTVLQSPISKICISAKLGNTWLPCTNKQEHKLEDSKHESLWDEINGRRRLLISGGTRRVLAAADKCASKGKVPLVSLDGVHQLHMFIFVLAIFHVLYCVTTLVLGRAKMRRWKVWEKETRTAEYKFNNDPERFRFARETTFGRRHLSFWTTTPSLLWFVCFFRQFIRSVPKVDYLTLRHGFIMAHLTPQSEAKFDFQKYINRSLEKDFKVVVGISPPMWLFAVFFLLFNTHGWYSYLWLPFLPLIIILLVGTKLQVIITKMGLRIQDRNEIVKGVPIVEPNDDLFWFNHPRLLLFLINFVLFQNAFELAFFAWTWYTFGLRSCFHDHVEDIIIRFVMGVLIQVLCSYVTLPLYALVTQMGTNMKPTIFNEKVATALKGWHHTAKKRIKDQSNKNDSASITPTSSRPGTPSRHGMSPMHPRNRSYYQSEIDMMSSAQSTVHDKSDFDDLKENWGGANDNADRIDSSKSPSRLFSNHGDGRQSPRHELSSSSSLNHTAHKHDDNNVELKIDDDTTTSLEITHVPLSQREVNVKEQIDFSFDKRLD